MVRIAVASQIQKCYKHIEAVFVDQKSEYERYAKGFPKLRIKMSVDCETV
jgi:hypothetical protein